MKRGLCSAAALVSLLVLDLVRPDALSAGTLEGVHAVTADPQDPCLSPGSVLCLHGGRFQVEVAWQETPSGTAHPAPARPISPKSGYFWFFAPENVEVAVKILDGTSVNGHFWVFFGALSNVEYTVSVTDTSTGEIRSYHNAAGTLASVADTQAFPGHTGTTQSSVPRATEAAFATDVSWVPIGPDATTAVYALAVDPHDSGVVYASAGGESYRIFKTSDGGATWTALVTLPGFAYKIVLDPHASEVLFVLTTEGAYRSTDGGATLEPFGTDLGIGDLEFDSVSPGTIYAGTVDGFLVSTDGGGTWAARGQELVGRGIGPIATTPSGEFYAAAAFAELWASSDAGESWNHVHSFQSEGLSSLVADPSDGRTVYASPSCCGVWTGSTPFPPAPVLKSTDSGATWTEVLGEHTGSTSIVLDPVDPRAVYAGGDAGVFRSANAGTSWTRFADGISEQRVFTLATAPGSLFAGTDGGVFRLDVSGLPGSCEQAGHSLCLNDSRFRVAVAFTRTPSGPTMLAPAVPMTSDTGYFWFFDDANVELVVKVLDGRSVNGHFWVFYGAMSTVEYTVTVTDTQTGEQRSYPNPRGNLASVADTAAF